MPKKQLDIKDHSKHINYQQSCGLKYDGKIPEEYSRLMYDIEAWMKAGKPESC